MNDAECPPRFCGCRWECNQVGRPSRENLVARTKFVRVRRVLGPRIEIGIDELPICAADRLFKGATQGSLNAPDVEEFFGQIVRQVCHELPANVAPELEFIQAKAQACRVTNPSIPIRFGRIVWISAFLAWIILYCKVTGP